MGNTCGQINNKYGFIPRPCFALKGVEESNVLTVSISQRAGSKTWMRFLSQAVIKFNQSKYTMIYLSLLPITTFWIYNVLSQTLCPDMWYSDKSSSVERLCAWDWLWHSLTLYLFLQPGTGQANGFSSPPFMHMELRMDSELMALSVVHDSSLSDSS